MSAPERTRTPAEEQTRAATRPVLWFSVLLLAALWFSVLNPPWPMPLLSGVLALAAIVLGVIALRRIRRARVGGMMTVLVVFGMVLAAAMVLLTGAQAIMWPVYADFYACVERALTHQAERQCLSGLENAAQNQFFDLLRQSTTTP